MTFCDGDFLFYFLIQQFITQDAQAVYGSYFVTMYIETETIQKLKGKKRIKKKGKREKREK